MLQIVRPDIVIPLSEYTPPAALAATTRSARVPRIEDDESRPHEERDRARWRGRAAARAYEAVKQVATAPAPALLAADIMTERPHTLPLEASVAEAHEVFRTQHFHHIPLTHTNGRIGGIISQPYLFRHAHPAVGSVAELAVTDVLTATPDTEIRAIAAAMLEHRVGCVPIVDADGRPVGIITRSDILHVLVQRAPVELWA